MNQNPVSTTNERNILLRGLFMIAMAFAFQLSGTVLCFVSVIQFALALLTGAPNARLLAFGRNLATYLKQVVCFLSFASEDIPFPFGDWPSSE